MRNNLTLQIEIYSTPLLLIVLNLLIYSFSLIFFFLILFSLKIINFKSINDFKNLMQTSYFINFGVFLFLSLAGLPPFLGFVGKFLMFIFLFSKFNLSFLLIFFFFNCFVIYFYIQHLKFLIFKKRSFTLNTINNTVYFNFNVIWLLNVFLFFLIFGIFFFQNWIIFLIPLCLI